MNKARWKTAAAAVGLPLWLAATTALGASLMATHWYSLPKPSLIQGERLASLRSEKGWLAVHVLYANCRCSQRVLEHLMRPGRPSGVEEIVLWVGDASAARPPTELALRVVSITPEALEARFGVESAPLLVVIDANGHAHYRGGYTLRKQGLDIKDLSIIADAVRGHEPSALPVFGCGVSKRVRDLIDPLGLK